MKVIHVESYSPEKTERYHPEKLTEFRHLPVCLSLTTCSRSRKVKIIVPPTVSSMYCMYSMCKCMCESLCTLVCLCRSSYWLLLSLRIPLKSLLSLSSQPSNRPFCRSFSLPRQRFPSLSFPWTFSVLDSLPTYLFLRLSFMSFSLFLSICLYQLVFLCRVPA